jgi:glucose uptake protein GlcU
MKPFIFGVLWGIGGLTFGLSMRYLGISLGMAIALGLTLVFGALLPSIFVSVMPECLTIYSRAQQLLMSCFQHHPVL